MTFDFDTPVDRRGTNSLKWDVAEHELPMWVADMDFAVAEPIQKALQERLDRRIFGYSILPDEWADAYIAWWGRRHQLAMSREELIFSTGVVPSISTCVRKLTSPGDQVLIMTPVYNIFFNSILNNQRVVRECPLRQEGVEFSVNWEDLEAGLADPKTSLMILCNPQNPVGKIWEEATLARIGELAEKYHVVVLSDEIHCDLTDPGCRYTPFARVSEVCRNNSVTCLAPTKTFNIAGLQTSAVFVPNPKLRYRVWRALNTDEVAEPNAFAVQAAIAAFSEGEPWLEALCSYIYENKQTVKRFLENEIPQIRLIPSDATYLLWLDCTELQIPSVELAAAIRKKTGLYLSDGEEYGNGTYFLRMNIACPRSRLLDGLARLKAFFD